MDVTLAVEDVNAKSDDVVEVHKYTFFLCPLDVGNIDDQCRGICSIMRRVI